MATEAKAAVSGEPTTAVIPPWSAKLSRRYLDAFKSTLFQQCWVLVSAALLLESLQANLFVLVAMAGHWLLILWIAIRRPKEPSRWDLLFCEFGFVPVLLVTLAVAPIVWFAVGESTLYERWFRKVMIGDAETLFPVQVVAGIGIIVMMGWMAVDFVLDTFWRKAKPKRVKAAGHADAPVVVAASKVKKAPASAKAPQAVPKGKRPKARDEG